LVLGPPCKSLFLAILCALVCGASGCGPERPPAAGGAAAAGWEWLQTTKQSLDVDRRRLARLEAPADPAVPAQSPAAAPEDIRRLRAAIDRRTSQLGLRLVAFINSHPPVDGQPLTPVQSAALRMKSDEDIVLARAYIDQGGDYRRAIEILEAAFAIDSGHARLGEELTRARRQRYMTRARFVLVKRGMDADEVRRLLGQPNLHNVRDYPDRQVEAWFYPKDDSGAAAAVWFKQGAGGKSQDDLTVYKADFEAVPAPGTPARPPAAPAGAP
jgi:hypothetical protein